MTLWRCLKLYAPAGASIVMGLLAPVTGGDATAAIGARLVVLGLAFAVSIHENRARAERRREKRQERRRELRGL